MPATWPPIALLAPCPAAGVNPAGNTYNFGVNPAPAQGGFNFGDPNAAMSGGAPAFNFQ